MFANLKIFFDSRPDVAIVLFVLLFSIGAIYLVNRQNRSG